MTTNAQGPLLDRRELLSRASPERNLPMKTACVTALLLIWTGASPAWAGTVDEDSWTPPWTPRRLQDSFTIEVAGSAYLTFQSVSLSGLGGSVATQISLGNDRFLRLEFGSSDLSGHDKPEPSDFAIWLSPLFGPPRTERTEIDLKMTRAMIGIGRVDILGSKGGRLESSFLLGSVWYGEERTITVKEGSRLISRDKEEIDGNGLMVAGGWRGSIPVDPRGGELQVSLRWDYAPPTGLRLGLSLGLAFKF